MASMTPEQVSVECRRLLDNAKGSAVQVELSSELGQVINKARIRGYLVTNERIIATIDIPGNNITLVYADDGRENSGNQSQTQPKTMPKVDRHHHTYVAPKFFKDVIDMFNLPEPIDLLFVGPTGCGKTTFVKWLGDQLGRKVYLVRGSEELTKEELWGGKTVEIDENSKQNHIVYRRGIVVDAMLEGLDENGNEVGPPAILFVDEFAAIRAEVGLHFNHLAGCDDARRDIILDDGSPITSHSGFRMVFAGNTKGRGAADLAQMAYTAQSQALDISTLDRLTVMEFGYDRRAEKAILQQKTGDDRVTEKVLSIRDQVRQALRQSTLMTPFSTRTIVNVARQFQALKKLEKAIYYVVMTRLLPEEKTKYNEICFAVLGVDILKTFEDTSGDYDFM